MNDIACRSDPETRIVSRLPQKDVLMDEHDSFAVVFRKLNGGDEAGAQEVFDRFAKQLIARARNHLGVRLQQKVDPEDVVQSVFKSFFVRQAEDKFSLEKWESLWGLLLQITVRKCHRWAEHYGAARRRIQSEQNLDGSGVGSPFMEPVDEEPQPSEIAFLNELLDGLKLKLDALEWEVLTLRLQEYTVPEISTMISRSERTVARVLQRVKTHLAQNLAD